MGKTRNPPASRCRRTKFRRWDIETAAPVPPATPMAAYQNAECKNAVSQHHARNHFVSRIPQIGRQSRTKRACSER